MSDDVARASDAQQRSEADIAREMRLHPDPPRVVRLSRKAIIGLGAASAVALSGALFWGLRGSHRVAPPELINVAGQRPSEALDRLPHDYSAVPRLGPPLPGDLGRPILAAGAQDQAGAQPPTPVPATAPNPAIQRRQQQRMRMAEEREGARSSRLFLAGITNDAPATLAGPTPGAGSSGASGTAPPSITPAASELGTAFLNHPSGSPTIASGRLEPPPGAYVIQAGAVIPAALLTGLNSDLPGLVTAQVTEPVFDSPTGSMILIPQGSRLIGEYDSETRYGQRRALLAWTRLIFPDGRSIALDRQPGADPQGMAGLTDRVNNHWGQVFKAALVSTFMSIGADGGTSNEQSRLILALRRGSSDGISRAGQQIVQRSLDIQPTLTIRPGFPVRVIVTRDLVLEPWKG